MRCADARSAQIGRPDGVARSFQVSRYKVEPSEPILACNLLAKDDWRHTLSDEREPDGPEVARVVDAFTFPGGAERLTGTGTCPDRPVVGPPGEPEREAPSADAGEEVALGEASEVFGLNIGYGPLVYFTRRDMPASDQFTQPSRGLRIELVVVGCHDPIASRMIS